MVDLAESFHDKLGSKAHPNTFNIGGTGHKTVDAIEMRVESNWVRSNPYPTRGFQGFFTDAGGHAMQAVLQDPAGDGDETVPRSSSKLLEAAGKPAPGDTSVPVKHQPAYQDAAVQAYVRKAILALCKLRYYEKRGGGVGDFPARAPNSRTA